MHCKKIHEGVIQKPPTPPHHHPEKSYLAYTRSYPVLSVAQAPHLYCHQGKKDI